MKSETLYDLLGNIRDDYVSEAEASLQKRKTLPIRWFAVAAVFLLAMTAVFALPLLKDSGQPPLITPDTVSPDGQSLSGDTELAVSEKYVYRVDDTAFSSYVGGKVIEEKKVGNKIREVSVTAGWQDREGEPLSQETLRAEVYEIADIDSDTAVALKFLDKGDAVTTTYFYTLINPDGDLSSIEGYFIPADGGAVREIPEGMIFTSVITDEAVTEEGIVKFTTAVGTSSSPDTAPVQTAPVQTAPVLYTSEAYDPSTVIPE